MSTTAKKLDIAIIGAGVVGVCAAIGLVKHGVNVQIYEAAEKLKEEGGSVGLSPDAIAAMKLILPEIEQILAECVTKNGSKEDEDTWTTVCHGGRDTTDDFITKIKTTDRAKTGQSLVHRYGFLQKLVDFLPAGVMKFGKSLVTVTTGPSSDQAIMEFEDGCVIEADAILGCDGIRSKVRDSHWQRTDYDPTYANMYVYRGVIPMEVCKKELGEDYATNCHLYINKGGYVVTYPTDGGKFFNAGLTFHSNQPWNHHRWIKRNQTEAMRVDFMGWGPTVLKIVNLMSEEVPSVDCWALYHINNIGKYNKGKILLLGDAAHAATPHQAGGVGQCVEDALVISELLGDLPDSSYHAIINACRAYNIIRRPRARKLVSTSYEAGLLYSFMGPEGDDIHAIKKNLETRMRWIWEEDMEDQVRRAKEVFKQLEAGDTGKKE
ncbi:hypothetical protein EG329_007715 [Mollisiaceae sp. DMI_Dod_QoI]|nr:hypothetical protein EG329_007715 [Helotiales sp. DMI_Dod_QoI]